MAPVYHAHMGRWGNRRRQAKIQRARQLRRELTPAEHEAWKILRNRRVLGFKFRRQHIVCGFITDFYCHELRLAIEIDGRGHLDQERTQYDAARTERMEMDGVIVVRIRNDQVSERGLRALIESLSYRSPSPQRGEGDRG